MYDLVLCICALIVLLAYAEHGAKLPERVYEDTLGSEANLSN